MGILYLIPVPIAEEDFSKLIYPALAETVNSLNEFIVEDIRTARRSLRKIGYKGDFDKTIFHLLNKHTDVKNSISGFLISAEKEKDIGLMSEAGMPCIADPGSEIVRMAHQKGIRVIPLYGQSSIFLALASSGLNGQDFCFHGYLPKEQNKRIAKIKELERAVVKNNQTQIFIETPYRNNHLFDDLLTTCAPTVKLCIASDIAGKLERILTKIISDWKKSPTYNLSKQPTVFLIGS